MSERDFTAPFRGPGLDDVITEYARKLKRGELRGKLADAATVYVKYEAKGTRRAGAYLDDMRALVAELDSLEGE